VRGSLSQVSTITYERDLASKFSYNLVACLVIVIAAITPENRRGRYGTTLRGFRRPRRIAKGGHVKVPCDTPAPGQVRNVKASRPAARPNDAACGDHSELEAGGRYSASFHASSETL